MRVLGLGAHPDDVEIFCLGLLLRCQARGDDIGWVIATDGARGGAGDPAALAALRRKEATAAGAAFGVTPVFLDRPDGALAHDMATTALVEAAIAGADLVITHAPNDYHPDHRALSRIVIDAARFRVPVLYADTLLGVDAMPTLYVDISRHFEAKKAAISAHASQRPERFIEAAEVWNRFRAFQCGFDSCRYAEAFSFEPRFPFGDIRSLLPQGPKISPMGQAERWQQR